MLAGFRMLFGMRAISNCTLEYSKVIMNCFKALRVSFDGHVGHKYLLLLITEF